MAKEWAKYFYRSKKWIKCRDSYIRAKIISLHHNAGIKGKAGGGTVVYYYNDAAMQAAAKRLYDAVITHTGLAGNRSSKVAVGNYYVIKYTEMPALLLENGFMDSTYDTPIILTEAHATKTAQGIVDFLVTEPGLNRTGDLEQGSSASGYTTQDKDLLPYITVNKGDTLYGIARIPSGRGSQQSTALKCI